MLFYSLKALVEKKSAVKALVDTVLIVFMRGRCKVFYRPYIAGWISTVALKVSSAFITNG